MCQGDNSGKKKAAHKRLNFLHQSMVPKAGLEPARISTVDFESTASTDFATSALKRMRKTLGIIPLRTKCATGINRVVR